ncbi:glutamate--cysteine ligase [Rhodococcus kroppenstedtii]|nr:glutamate--cysteine ligase [Rhodococcus kroppenstedtii]
MAGVPTVGVEEEFFLVDPVTSRLVDCNGAVADRGRATGVDVVSELTRYQVETNSRPERDMHRLRRLLAASRRGLSAAAHSCGVAVLAAGVCPTPAPERGPAAISDTSRYHRLAETHGALAFADPCCGCHIHVEMPDRATAIGVSNHLRPWLPVLLALTANSAIHDGVDTRHRSWRSVLWGRWPTAGPPPVHRSPEHFDETVRMLIDCGAILDEASLYWDIRPSAHHPTIEIRVSDIPATVEETVLLAALVRALATTARWAHDAGRPAPEPQFLDMAYRCAQHSGMDGTALDPMTGTAVTPTQMLDRLLSTVRPALLATGDDIIVRELSRTIARRGGTGAARQRAIYTETKDSARVMRSTLLPTPERPSARRAPAPDT